MTILRGLDLLVLTGFDGGSFRRIDLHLSPDNTGANRTSICTWIANRGAICLAICTIPSAICTSSCTIPSANCTWISTIQSANCTCRLHLLKCKLHIPFALQKLDLHQQAREIAEKGRFWCKSRFQSANGKCYLHLEWCKWQVQFALGMVEI